MVQNVTQYCHVCKSQTTSGPPVLLILEYKWVSDSQSPRMAMSASCGEVWGSRLSRIFLHRESGIPISRMYKMLFSILWHISGNFSYYYAGVMLDAHESLLCSKLCQHNVDDPNFRGARSGCHSNVTEIKAVIFYLFHLFLLVSIVSVVLFRTFRSFRPFRFGF